MKIFVLVLDVLCEFISECDLPDDNVLSLYTTKDQQDAVPIFKNLSYQYDNLVFRDVNCDLCECSVKNFPKIILSKNKMQVDEDTIKKDDTNDNNNVNINIDAISMQRKIEEFLYNNGFAKENNEIMSDKGEVREMKLVDFSKLLINPWLVLFYDDKYSSTVKLFEKIAKSYTGKVNVGKVHKSEIANYEKMFNVYNYPTVIAFYDELTYKFENTMTYENLESFTNTLIQPVLPELTYNELIYNRNLFNKKETIFIVFYQNKNLAISYFRKISQMYRFISKFYISNDPDLIKHASVSFVSMKRNVAPKDVIVLSAFRNNKFHHLKLANYNFELINNWIFHSHHPILTRITNQNFYRIFQGLKPVILLLTEGDTLNQDLETFAENYHDNKLSTDFVFATLDVHEMHGFVDSLLPGYSIPGLVIYDPVRMIYLADKKVLTQKNFSEYIENTISMYQKGKLKAYPFVAKTSYMRSYIILAIIVCAIVFCLVPSRKKIKKS
ncbi:hypothetical protein BDAP_001714 [Binucleata daphniae]